MIKRIYAKLGNMRKVQDWIVYPQQTDKGNEILMIQSDTRMCRIDTTSRKGMLSKNKLNGAGFADCLAFLGATEIEVPQEVINAAIEAQPKSGDEIGPSGSRFVA